MAIERERADSLRRSAQRQEEAAVELARSAVTLWRTQLDMAVEFGDDEAVRAIVEGRGPVAWGDNNCQCARGGGGVLA